MDEAYYYYTTLSLPPVALDGATLLDTRRAWLADARAELDAVVADETLVPAVVAWSRDDPDSDESMIVELAGDLDDAERRGHLGRLAVRMRYVELRVDPLPPELAFGARRAVDA
ncbi:MAG: hypothetical protein R3F65_30080 [bacterium]